MAKILKPITQSGYTVYLNGVSIFFTSFSGISDSADTSTYASGTGNRILPVVGPKTMSEITLGTPWDRDIAKELEELWADYNCEALTISVQPTECNGESLGQPYILEGCLLSGINLAEVNREDSSVSMIELTLQAATWRRG